MPTDRSHWQTRKTTLAHEGEQDDLSHLSPSERVAMVWQLTVQAWTFKDGQWNEPRLRRDVGRVIRGAKDLADLDALESLDSD